MARAKSTTKKRSFPGNAKDVKRAKKATSKRKASPKTTRATATGTTRPTAAAQNRKTTAKRKASPKKKRAGATKATAKRKASPKRAATTKVPARTKATSKRPSSKRTRKATPPTEMPVLQGDTSGQQMHTPERDSVNHTESHDTIGLHEPNYEAEVNEVNADAIAFLRHAGTERDDFAEERGETTVETMTSGEYFDEDQRDQIVPEEHGGPFVETGGRKEFASGTDPSNPDTATREPFPRS
ncbi:MAG: hypothetical protein FWD73_05110 [Polyangiaceae bacterium]|nr:hypothetical protein [Polyangiaceae bacterium]